VYTAWKNQADGYAENPAPPSQNNHVWSNFFAERAALGLSEEIGSTLKEQSQSIKNLNRSIDKALNSAFSKLQPYFESMASSVLQSTQSQTKRGDLIWWKQSLYSNTLDMGYRQVESIAVALAMAVDLNNSVEDIYPKSVDYFLEETLRDVLKEEINSSIELKEFSNLIPEVKSLLRVLVNGNKGRKQLASCLALFVEGKLSEGEFYKSVGMDVGTKITISEFTVWLLHDLKAHNLANKK
ncbi:MAG: GTPase-associated system all-helical protein GASH, partial [Colwellia sp.]